MRYTFQKSARIIWHVGWSDFFLKYRGSMLGYLWALLSPLAKFLVVYFVFQPLVGDAIPRYPLYLFLGLIVWEHFTLTTTHCMSALYEKASFIQKMSFPRLLLMYIVGWSDLLVFLSYFLIFTLFAFFAGAGMTRYWLYVPVVVLQMTLLALGVGMLLASYCLKYRDIPHLWGIATQVLFWLTPITYAYRLDMQIHSALVRIPEMLMSPDLRVIFDTFVHFQPLSILIDDIRRVTLYAGIPSVLHVLGFTTLLGVFFGVSTIMYQRRSPYFVEEY